MVILWVNWDILTILMIKLHLLTFLMLGVCSFLVENFILGNLMGIINLMVKGCSFFLWGLLYEGSSRMGKLMEMLCYHFLIKSQFFQNLISVIYQGSLKKWIFRKCLSKN